MLDGKRAILSPFIYHFSFSSFLVSAGSWVNSGGRPTHRMRDGEHDSYRSGLGSVWAVRNAMIMIEARLYGAWWIEGKIKI